MILNLHLSISCSWAQHLKCIIQVEPTGTWSGDSEKLSFSGTKIKHFESASAEVLLQQGILTMLVIQSSYFNFFKCIYILVSKWILRKLDKCLHLWNQHQNQDTYPVPRKALLCPLLVNILQKFCLFLN